MRKRRIQIEAALYMIPAGFLLGWNNDGDAMLCSIAEPHVYGFITAELTMFLGSMQQKGQSD